MKKRFGGKDIPFLCHSLLFLDVEYSETADIEGESFTFSLKRV